MNLPIDFQNQMKEILGKAYDAFISEYDKPYFCALRCNTRKIRIEELCKLLSGKLYSHETDDSIQNPNDSLSNPCNLSLNSDDSVHMAQPCNISHVPWEKMGLYYDEPPKDEEGIFRPGKSAFFEAGLYYIQEPSAMLPVTELDVDDSGLKVLDLCASPGGKTTQIADYMMGKGLLIANEIVPSRAKILSENIERMGVDNAIVISADPRDICDRFEGFFDRILVDAPCSGEGMFRKHPEAATEWSLDNVKACAERQSWILDCAVKMLKNGGKMVYSTCTFNTQEDEKSVRAFLERHPEVDIIRKNPLNEGDEAALISGSEFLGTRLFPHVNKGEGHFAASFIKNIPGSESAFKYPMEKEAKKESFKPFFDFAKETLTEDGLNRIKNSGGVFITFGDQLYLAPEGTPVLTGLKVLRPGLHLGTIKKERFEPSHALALFLNKKDVKSVYDFDEGSQESVRYLKGESLTCDKKGWTLVTVCGYSAGWGKASNGILKNHYPKGLRWT